MQRPIPQQPQAAGISGDIPADMARPLCAEIERKNEALLCEHVVGRFEHDAGIGYESARDGVKRADRVEVGKGEDELVVYGVGTAFVSVIAFHGTTMSKAAAIAAWGSGNGASSRDDTHRPDQCCRPAARSQYRSHNSTS